MPAGATRVDPDSEEWKGISPSEGAEVSRGLPSNLEEILLLLGESCYLLLLQGAPNSLGF